MTQPGELLLDPGLAGSRPSGQVLIPGIERVPALPGQLRGTVLGLTDL